MLRTFKALYLHIMFCFGGMDTGVLESEGMLENPVCSNTSSHRIVLPLKKNIPYHPTKSYNGPLLSKTMIFRGIMRYIEKLWAYTKVSLEV